MSSQQSASTSRRPSDAPKALPPGWNVKESRKHPGQFYYVGPKGQTSWTFPEVAASGEGESAGQRVSDSPPKTGETASVRRTSSSSSSSQTAPTTGGGASRRPQWKGQLEVEFGSGPMGLSLKQSKAAETILPELQAEIEAFTKGKGSQPGAAELYNWSVPPERRLKPGMRLTYIGESDLWGRPYNEIAALMKGASRPITLKFIDVETEFGLKKTDARVMESSASSPASSSAPQSEASRLLQDYRALLVVSGIRVETLRKAVEDLRKEKTMVKKNVGFLVHHYRTLSKENQQLKMEAEMLRWKREQLAVKRKNLQLQMDGKIESPEVVRFHEMNKRNRQLQHDVELLNRGNKDLAAQCEQISNNLSAMQSKLKSIDDKKAAERVAIELEGLAGDIPVEEQLAKVSEKVRLFEQDMAAEEEKSAALAIEIQQLSKQRQTLRRNESNAAALLSGKKSPGLVSAEAKVEALRAEVREIVNAIAQAAKTGQPSSELQKRRLLLKSELARAQDELNLIKQQEESMSLTSASSSFSSGQGTPKSASKTMRPHRYAPQ